MYWRQVLASSVKPRTPGLMRLVNDILTPGMMRLPPSSFSGWEPKKLWRNPGGTLDRPFEECAFAEGLDSRADGRSVVAVDLDGDGDLDVALLNRAAPRLQLFENTGPQGQALELRLQPGPASSPEGEGAQVQVQGGGRHAVTLARGFASSVEPVVHLGLGQARAATVEVSWRSGAVQTFTLEAGAQVTLREGAPAPVARRPFASRPARPQESFPSSLAALGIEADGRPTLVQLFSRGCAPCAQEAVALGRLAAARADVRVLGLGLHPPEELGAAARALGIRYPVFSLGEEAAQALSTGGELPVPMLLGFDASGALRRVAVGAGELPAVAAELTGR